MKWVMLPPVVQVFAHFGLPLGLGLGVGILEFVCAAVYAIPQTSALGAILMTGYLGGATLANLRVDGSVVVPVDFARDKSKKILTAKIAKKSRKGRGGSKSIELGH